MASAPDEVTVALDGMGGDHAPEAPCRGALLALERLPLRVLLVGRPDALAPHLPTPPPPGLAVVAAAEAIPMDVKEPAAAARGRDTSIAVGLRLLKEGRAQAFVSAGHTGAVMAAALLLLGRRRGIRRPALAVPFPTRSGACILLDVGANPDCKAEWLVQFGEMGAQVAERILGIPQPGVGLLSIGEEESKGSPLVLAAHGLFREAPFRFVGNVEGNDIPEGRADVVVTDGFTGNVCLKLAEGVGMAVGGMVREELTRSLRGRLGALVARPALQALKRRLDWSEYGGGLLLGVDGVVVIPHGRSNPKAISQSLRVAYEAQRTGLLAAVGAARPSFAAPSDQALS